MKKLVIIAIVLGFVTTVNAQIRFGVKAGANASQLYTSGASIGLNADQYKFRFSYHFGGVMEYSFSDMFAIQPELMYMNQGANLKSDNSFGMADGHVTLNSIQLPVNVKASFPLGKNKLYVYAGPYVGYNIYGKARGKIDGNKQDASLFSKGSDMKRLDYGVGMGVGIEVNKFTIGVGNQFGLCDINDATGKMKAGNITLSVGYFF